MITAGSPRISCFSGLRLLVGVMRCRGPTAPVLLVMLLNWTVPLDVLVSTLDSSVCLKAWISRLD